MDREDKDRDLSLKELYGIIKTLRSPEGCPWDRMQTHSTLRRYFLEEVYELLEAIDNKDIDNLREELGDVLLQILFHSALAEEEGWFTIQNVIDDVSKKMIHRHPHVFHKDGHEKLDGFTASWEELKAQEQGHERKFLLDGVSKGLPSLLRAQKLQEKAKNVGFDWLEESAVWEKFYEEIDEFKEAIHQKNQENIELEGGDVLFSLINLFRWYKISGENALRRTNNKFQRRFTFVERCVQESGKGWEEFSLAELDAFWNKAKMLEQEHSTQLIADAE
ncbi:nucleoside triphosphate pyrophosphohydrolase [Veillonella montpellierensis]|uniref:nucleoside triphosphate pyrophosphohydrolase n=1 Tax=Veillonella montpellierensis TaxID=187328 RepID=UPI0003F6F46C|nr:nucleoside triphosphate pyrophosphohydrolase [Veillonella montpellierensis]